MKKFLAIALPLTFLVACNSVEKHRASIETLGTEWDNTTNMVTDFAASVEAEQAAFQMAADSSKVADDVAAKLKEDKKTMLMEAYTAYTTAGAGYAAIKDEVSSFDASWKENAAKVQALKDGLAAGKIEGDVVAQVAELNTVIADAVTKLDEWKTRFEEAKTAVANAQTTYMTARDGATASK